MPQASVMFVRSSQSERVVYLDKNLPEITSLAAFDRLQNAVKYCTKVRKTGPAGQGVEYFDHCLT